MVVCNAFFLHIIYGDAAGHTALRLLADAAVSPHHCLHSLLTGSYASIWIALVIFVYLSYFDMGRIFLDYGQMLCAPEMQQSLREAGMQPMIDALSAGHGAEGVAHTLQRIGVANYAFLPIYLRMLFGPLLPVLIGWGARRSPRNYRA